MHFSIKHIPAIIRALTRFVQVLEQCPRGGRMLIAVLITVGALILAPQLPTALQQAGPTLGDAEAHR